MDWKGLLDLASPETVLTNARCGQISVPSGPFHIHSRHSISKPGYMTEQYLLRHSFVSFRYGGRPTPVFLQPNSEINIRLKKISSFGYCSGADAV